MLLIFEIWIFGDSAMVTSLNFFFELLHFLEFIDIRLDLVLLFHSLDGFLLLDIKLRKLVLVGVQLLLDRVLNVRRKLH